jgi:hypothetical protein
MFCFCILLLFVWLEIFVWFVVISFLLNRWKGIEHTSIMER